MLPGSVRLSLRLLRLSRRAPSRLSMCMMCLLTIGQDGWSRSAAPTKLPDSTTFRNTLMLVRVSIAHSCSLHLVSPGRGARPLDVCKTHHYVPTRQLPWV